MDLRKLHNMIKRDLIDSLDDAKLILDAGCGCGGDLPKWKQGMVVYACDPNPESLKEARKRHSKATVHFFNGDISKTPVHRYDAICYNFSIQYIFSSPHLFFSTMKNIQERSVVGTKLIGVVPDSEELLLRGMCNASTKIFGNEVEFFIEGAPYYKNGPVKEPVCYKEFLVTHLERIGFRLDTWEPFVSFVTGTISDVYAKFIFTRVL